MLHHPCRQPVAGGCGLRDLIEDAVISVIDDLAEASAYAFFVKEDNCYLNGDGTSTYAGMNGIVAKPLSPAALVARIAAIVAESDEEAAA